MNHYQIVETSLIIIAIVASAVYAVLHLAPAQVAIWRREVLLWLIAERRPESLRHFGRKLARTANAAPAAGSCGPCKGCTPAT